MQAPSAEGQIVRLICYVVTAISLVWLMGAISAGGSFWAPLVGTVVGIILSLPMYLKEQDTEQIREAKNERESKSESRADTGRWNVEDSGDPTVPPKILES